MKAHGVGAMFACLRNAMLFMLVVAGLGLLAAEGMAQVEPAAAPQKVQDLLKLMGDPEVQKWVDAQKAAQPQPPAGAAAAVNDEMLFTAALARIHQHFSDLAAAIPGFPVNLPRQAPPLARRCKVTACSASR